MVMNFDVRLAGTEEERRVVEYGFEMLSNPNARVEVRRRSADLC